MKSKAPGAPAVLKPDARLVAWHDALLFRRAYPADAAQLRATEAALARIASFVRRLPRPLPAALHEQGLPFAPITSRFSHDCVAWLLRHPQARVALDGWREPLLDLSAVLKLTLPSLERDRTTAGLSNDDLLDALQVPKAERLRFVIRELARLNAQPLLKDQLFEALDPWVTVTPTQRALSKAFNRLPMDEVFFHDGLLKQFDHEALLASPLPPPRPLDAAARAQVVQVLKNTMLLTVRETDPVTSIDERTLRVHDLERGISVAIFGMTPDRQLPLESYVGFTLFKNGMPAAYGGSWLLGRRAAFGMNVFEPYRGGESGFVMCQLLRTYRYAFDIDYFEVDAHQFGLDNPDGIASGAFWFYHRYGFRPLDPELAALAAREKAKMARQPGYRSSERTLRRFTASNVALDLGVPKVPVALDEITGAVTRWIARAHRGDRRAAEADAMAQFEVTTGTPCPQDGAQRAVYTEVALVAQALRVTDPHRLGLLAAMVAAKPDDLFGYQGLLLAFFQG
jgi:hypothetical protein